MISYHLVSTVFNQQRQHSFQSAAAVTAQFSITVFNQQQHSLISSGSAVFN